MSLIGCGDGADPATDPTTEPVLAPEQSERFERKGTAPADIVFIIDNSCSMQDEQLSLVDNRSTILDLVSNSGLDFHLGTARMEIQFSDWAGRLERTADHTYIDSSMDPAEADLVFGRLFVVGTNGTVERVGVGGAELGRSVAQAIPEQERNTDFVRPDATLDYVFISDGDDRSTAQTEAEFVDWMASLKHAPDRVRAHAVVLPPGEVCDTAAGDGGAYVRHAEQTGGHVRNICQADWGPLVASLLDDRAVEDDYLLPDRPVAEPFTVRVSLIDDDGDEREVELCAAGQDDIACEADYHADWNGIRFREPIAHDVEFVDVHYSPL